MKHFIRLFFEPINTIILLLMFMVTYGFSLFLSSIGFTGFQLFYVIIRVNFYISFALAIVSFRFISKANCNYVKEIFDSARLRGYFESKALLLCVIVLLVWNTGMIVILVVNSLINDGTGYFITWFGRVYLYDIVLPQLICLGITFFVAESRNITKWSVGLIIFWFLVSPFAELITWREKPDYPLDKIWRMIHWPFNIFYQNGKWAPDSQGGMQTENARVGLLVFWLILIIALFVILYSKWIRSGYILILISIAMLVNSYMPSSLYRIDENWDGLWKDYNVYFSEKECKNMDKSFEVEKYEIDVELNRQLKAEVRLKINPKKEQKLYEFTLYRGYRIEEISCGGRSIEYTRNGDYCTFEHAEGEPFEVIIKYSGYSDKFYSNSIQALLPGWFAWYPMPGHLAIFNTYKDHGMMYGYNPYNRMDKTHIQLNCNQNIVCNLAKAEDGNFRGISDSITILGGNIKPTNDKLVADILPLIIEDSEASYIENIKADYKTAISELKGKLDITNLADRKILIASKELGRNMINNEIAVFEDYILMTPYAMDKDEILRYFEYESDTY